jgi:hypothetical protein
MGCVDAGLTTQRIEQGTLLHAHLSDAASHVTGVDIDQTGLELMRAIRAWSAPSDRADD